MRPAAFVLLLLALLIGAPSCGGGGDTSGPTRVASDDGRVVLEIPEAALQGVDVDRDAIEIRALPLEAPSAGGTPDAAYALLPDGLKLAAPARLEFELEPEEPGLVALHLSGGEDGKPDVEFLELTVPEQPEAADKRDVLVAEVDHFSEVWISHGSHGSFELTRTTPKEDKQTVAAGTGRVWVGYRVTRTVGEPHEYTYPFGAIPAGEFTYKVKVDVVQDGRWSVEIPITASTPLKRDFRVAEEYTVAGNVIQLHEELFTCDKRGTGQITASLEAVRSTLVASVEQFDRAGASTGLPTVVETTQGHLIDPYGFGWAPMARRLEVECVFQSDLPQYPTGVTLPGPKFTVTPVPIQYENGTGCGATPQYSYPHTLKFNGLRFSLFQLGHGTATDTFSGRVDPETGDFKLDINPKAPYDAGYDGQLKPDGSASGTYEFTYPEAQGGCTVTYDFFWEKWKADIIKELTGE